MYYNAIGETGGEEPTQTIGIESFALREYSNLTSPSRVSKKMAEFISMGLGAGISDHDGDRPALLYGRKMLPNISKVVFNQPATVVMWGDGAKTVVKVNTSGKKKDQDKFSEEIGLAMAIAKRYFGSRSAFLKAVENAKRPNAGDEQ